MDECVEPLSADVYDALLRDLFGDSNATVSTFASSTMAPSSENDDLRIDLAAFDALVQSSEDLLREMDVAANTVHDANDACLTKKYAAAAAAAAAATVTKKPKCAPGGNTARKRQREEIHALRETAELLERELQALQPQAIASPLHAYNRLRDSGGGHQHGYDSLSADQKASRRWLKALHQQQLGSKVPFSVQDASETLLAKEKRSQKLKELENRRLSKLVNDHVNVTQEFKNALRKRRLPMISEVFLATIPSSARSTSFLYFNKPFSAPPPPHTADDLATFEALARNVEMRYFDLERVFQAVGLASCRTNMTEARVDTDQSEAGGKTLKFKSSQVIPFNIRVIDETLLKTGRGPNSGTKSERIGQSVPFKKQFQAGDVTVSVRGVTKRFMEKDRIVVVWESLSEWPSEEGSSDETVVLQEKAWIVTQAFPKQLRSTMEKLQKENGSPSLSLLQSYISMTPIRHGGKWDDVPIQPKRLAILSDTVLPFYEKIFAGRVQHLENLLFEHALKPKLVAA